MGRTWIDGDVDRQCRREGAATLSRIKSDATPAKTATGRLLLFTGLFAAGQPHLTILIRDACFQLMREKRITRPQLLTACVAHHRFAGRVAHGIDSAMPPGADRNRLMPAHQLADHREVLLYLRLRRHWRGLPRTAAEQQS